MNQHEIIQFWFDPNTEQHWFSGDQQFDEQLRHRFTKTLQQARQGELWAWRDSIEGRLAEILVLDQFSRNIFRGTPNAFAQDPQALVLAQEAIRLGLDQELEPRKRTFLYMPFMHSESKTIHEQALALFQQLKQEIALEFEIKHKVIIDRFGRYPHRNQILGRTSTDEELVFLTQPDSHF